MGVFTYTLLLLLVGGMLLGVLLAGMVVGGIIVIVFLIGYLVYETIMWLKGQRVGK
jgi:hypothetical protein